MSEGCPNTESAYAAEGTLAHAIASEKLDHYFFGRKPASGKFTEPTADDMMAAVDFYVDYVKALAKKSKAKKEHVLIEHRFDLSSVYRGLYGTADAVIYDANSKKLYVIDYKHGAGIDVEVESNLQLQYYGLGALISTNFPCSEVELIIVQPRCGDGAPKHWRFQSYEILDFAADLAFDAAATEKADAPLVPGKHCRFCPAAATKCPAIKQKALTLAKMEFQPIEKGGYDPEKLGQALAFLDTIEAWAKKVREFAYAEAVHGRTPPGFKMVSKRATRVWNKPEEEIVKYMADATKKEKSEFYAEPKLKTPAQMEKLCSKQIGLGLREMMSSVSSGYSLVQESDNRPAVKLDPSADFTKIEVGENE